MKKLLLSLALAGSVFALDNKNDKKIEYYSQYQIQEIVNEQQAEINNQQEKINFA